MLHVSNKYIALVNAEQHQYREHNVQMENYLDQKMSKLGVKNIHILFHQTRPSFAWKMCPSQDNGPPCGGCREMIEVT